MGWAKRVNKAVITPHFILIRNEFWLKSTFKNSKKQNRINKSKPTILVRFTPILCGIVAKDGASFFKSMISKIKIKAKIIKNR